MTNVSLAWHPRQAGKAHKWFLDRLRKKEVQQYVLGESGSYPSADGLEVAGPSNPVCRAWSPGRRDARQAIPALPVPVQAPACTRSMSSASMPLSSRTNRVGLRQAGLQIHPDTLAENRGGRALDAEQFEE